MSDSLIEINAVIHDVDFQPEEWLPTDALLRRLRLARGEAPTSTVLPLLAKAAKEGLLRFRLVGFVTEWALPEAPPA